VVGGEVVVVVGARVVGVAVLGVVEGEEPPPDEGVVVVVGAVVVGGAVVGVVVELEGVVGDGSVGALDAPGCSFATTTASTPVAAAAVTAAKRVSRRSRALARSLD
jgi:hypothetical protein